MPRRSETKGIYSSQVAPGFTLWAIPGSSYKFQSFIDNSVVYQCQEEINPTITFASEACVALALGYMNRHLHPRRAKPDSESGPAATRPQMRS